MESRRTYVLVALGVFVVCAGLGYLAGPDLVAFISQTMAGAHGTLRGVEILIGEPLKWVFSNPLLGSLAIAVVWPLGALLLALFFVMMLIAIGGGAVLSLGNQTESMLR